MTLMKWFLSLLFLAQMECAAVYDRPEVYHSPKVFMYPDNQAHFCEHGSPLTTRGLHMIYDRILEKTLNNPEGFVIFSTTWTMRIQLIVL